MRCLRILHWLLPIVLLLVALGAALAGSYLSPKGYEITPAPGWQLDMHGPMSTDLVIIAKPASKFTANLNVIVAPCPRGATLSQLRAAEDTVLKSMTGGFKPISQGYTTIDGTKVLVTLANHDMESPHRQLYIHQDVAIKNGYAYTFTCTALQSNHAAYDAAFTQMLASIRWHTPAAAAK